MTKITSTVYLGSISDARKGFEDYDLILNVSEVSLKGLRGRFKGVLIEIPMDDTPDTDIRQYVPYTNDILDRAREKGNRVLINCYKGISRSASVLIAWLIHRGLSYREAYDMVSGKRPIIYPNEGFRAQLKKLQ